MVTVLTTAHFLMRGPTINIYLEGGAIFPFHPFACHVTPSSESAFFFLVLPTALSVLVLVHE